MHLGASLLPRTTVGDWLTPVEVLVLLFREVRRTRISPSLLGRSGGTILLVDDHAMVRQGLRTVLESYTDIEVVGEAADGEEAVAAVARVQPAIILMDINMPKKSGIEATAEIKAHWPDSIIIGLSVNPGGDNQAAMTHAGAVMLLTKEAAVDELYQAIQHVLHAEAPK
jgi:DNA-binding NarL/FixJ family response regulator